MWKRADGLRRSSLDCFLHCGYTATRDRQRSASPQIFLGTKVRKAAPIIDWLLQSHRRDIRHTSEACLFAAKDTVSERRGAPKRWSPTSRGQKRFT